MILEEILEKSIERAVEGGFRDKFSYRNAINEYLICYKYFAIIFDIDFAKAFWGWEIVGHSNFKSDVKFFNTYHLKTSRIPCSSSSDMYAWQFHLQQMVLEEEPLKYLERFL